MADQTPKRGRPEDPKTTLRILQAAAAQLAERAYGDVSMEGVAAAAGVSKPTLYRRYPSKVELMMALYQALIPLEMPGPALTDQRDEIARRLAYVFTRYRETGAGRLLLGLLGDSVAGAEVAEPFRSRFMVDRLRFLAEPLGGGAEAARLGAALTGLIWYRLIETNGDPGPDAALEIVETVLGKGGQTMDGSNGIDIREGYYPGMIGEITSLHMAYYGPVWGLGKAFEGHVAGGLTKILQTLDPAREVFFNAFEGDRLVGTITLQQGVPETDAVVRFFIVDQDMQGRGLGKILLDRLINRARAEGYVRIYLDTFEGLKAARALYESRGFRQIGEKEMDQWESGVKEQRFSVQL